LGPRFRTGAEHLPRRRSIRKLCPSAKRVFFSSIAFRVFCARMEIRSRSFMAITMFVGGMAGNQPVQSPRRADPNDPISRLLEELREELRRMFTATFGLC